MEKDIKEIKQKVSSISDSTSGISLWFIFLLFTTCGTNDDVDDIESDVNRLEHQIEDVNEKLDSILGFYAPDTLTIDSTYIDSVYAD